MSNNLEKEKRGLQGFQGDQGCPGKKGCRGPKGCPGKKGKRGYQGPDGPQGEEGATGPTGMDTDIPGPTGPTGGVGATGPTGPSPADGPTGPAGTGGVPPNILVGSTQLNQSPFSSPVFTFLYPSAVDFNILGGTIFFSVSDINDPNFSQNIEIKIGTANNIPLGGASFVVNENTGNMPPTFPLGNLSVAGGFIINCGYIDRDTRWDYTFIYSLTTV